MGTVVDDAWCGRFGVVRKRDRDLELTFELMWRKMDVAALWVEEGLVLG
jgi:hypothetical protein